MKPVPNGKSHTPGLTSPLPTPNKGSFGRVALPGLSTAHILPPRGAEKTEDLIPVSPASTKEPPREKSQEENSGERKSGVDKPHSRRPPVPHKPSRIPSTGNRATVMDVAQVWSQHEKQGSQDVASPLSISPNSPLESHPAQPGEIQAELDHKRELERERGREREDQRQENGPKADVKATVVGRDIQTPTLAPSTVGVPVEPEREDNISPKLPEVPSPTEKRKSSWEKYSEFIMPALEEEWTPVPSPMPTLNKVPVVALGTKEGPVSTPILDAKRSEELKVDYLHIDLLSTTLDPERKVIKVSPTDLVTFGEKIVLLFTPTLKSYRRLPELCCSEG